MANYTMHHLNVGSDTYEMVDEQGRANIAPSFSTSTTYAAGDYVIYGGKLYQFTASHTGAWTGTDAEETMVTEKLGGGSGDGLTEDIKQALLQIAQKVAYIDDQGATYYQALEDALYADRYPMITAIYTPSTAVIYTDDTLDTLKQYLTVTLYQSKDDTGTEIASSDYTLSGTLTEGTSIITVTYNNLRASVYITGVVDFYNKWNWSFADGDLEKLTASTDRKDTALTGITIRQDSVTQYRRHFSTKRGRLPYTVYNTETLSEYYPIPIPATANKVTVSITPSTQYTFLNIVKYDSNTNKYVYYAGASGVNGWTQGANTKTFTASDNLFLFFNTKYDSAGSSYPTEPTNLTVTFGEV